MKIAQILPGRIWGGAEQVGIDLACGLRGRGHDVTVIAHDNGVMRRRLGQERGPAVRYVDLRGRAPLAGLRELAALFREGAFEAVQVHSTHLVPLASLALRLAGRRDRTRLIVTRHDASSHPVGRLKRPFFRGVSRMVFVSGLGSKLWRERNGWFKGRRCTTVLNCIPERKRPSAAAKTQSVDLRALYGIPSSTPLLLFAGRLRATKGCGIIIDALSRLKDKRWAMVFVGAPKPKNYGLTLKRHAEAAGIAERVHIHGFTPFARDLIGSADLCLAPSTFIENCPLSPMESMKAGMCVIASNNGGQPEFITDGVTGLLVNPGDAQALADAITAMLDAPERREEIGAAAAAYVKTNLGFDGWVKRYEAILSGKA